jgi:CspA family cold shock protein
MIVPVKYRGIVTFFKPKPGFGFIRMMDHPDKEEIFVYWKYIIAKGFKVLEVDSLVEFELGENHKGPMAIRVKVLRMPDGSVPSYDDENDA